MMCLRQTQRKGILIPIVFLVLLLVIACGAAATATPQSPTGPETASATATPTTAPVAQATPTPRIREIAVATAVPTPPPSPVASAEGTRDVNLFNPQAKRGGVLRLASVADTAHFDVVQSATYYTAGPMQMLYNGVLRYNPLDGGNTIIPDLARDWTVSDDGTVWTFPLREGVKFHDGTVMTADDVVASWDRMLNPPEGVASLRRGVMAPLIEEVKAVDPLTVEVTLTGPSGFFLRVFAVEWNAIHPKAFLEEHNFDLRRVQGGGPGTGPFKFVSFTQGEKWINERHPEYWNEGIPYLDGVETFSVETAQRDALCIANQVDYCWNISPKGIEEVKNFPNTTSYIYPIVAANAVWFNIEKGPPWNDPRVRKAVSLVTDRWAIMDATEGLFGKIVSNWAPPGSAYSLSDEELLKLPGFRTDKSEDIAEAQRLMAEAGYANGIKNVDFSVRGGWAPRTDVMAPIVQEMLRVHLNIETNIRAPLGGQWQEDVRQGLFDIALGSLGTNIMDPSDYGNTLYRTGGDQNFSRWSNAEFDAIMDQIDAELDEEKRIALWGQAEEILDREVPMVAHHWRILFDAWYTYVKGVPIKSGCGIYNCNRWDTVWLDR